MAVNPYPWLEAAAKGLLDMDRKLPNSVILYGPKGIGLYDLAKRFAQGILCEEPAWNGTACGKCRSCACIRAHTHPGFREVLPQDLCEALEVPYEQASADKDRKTASREVRIHQIRALDSFFTLRAAAGEKRIVLIYPAERLRDEAASALLKTLEEPPEGMTFILVSEDIDSVLPTIRSRSRLVRAPMPSKEESIKFLSEAGVEDPEAALRIAGGSPLFALGMREKPETLSADAKDSLVKLFLKGNLVSPLDVVDGYPGKVDAAELADFWLRWTYDLVCVKSGLDMRYFDSALRPEIERLVIKTTHKQLAKWTKTLYEAKRLSAHPLEPRQNWEYLIVEYASAFMRR